MRLRVRLTLISAVVTTASTLTIGGIGINSQHQAQMNLLDKSLNQVANSVHGQTNAALSEALYLVQQSDISLTLVYFPDPKSPTVLVNSNLRQKVNPSQTEIQSAFETPVTHTNDESFRMRAVMMLDNEFLIVAGSLEEIDSRFNSDRLKLVFYILICLLIAGLVTWFFFRRDIRKIENLIETAEEISQGNTDTQIEATKGNSEVDQLTNSLNRMIVALREVAIKEEEASQRMQDFLGDASHELRTPLTVVKGYVELLAGKKFTDEDQRRRAYARVESEIQRMENLIKDLLFLAEFGFSQKVEMVALDFSKLVAVHVQDFHALHIGREVKTEIEPSLFIQGDHAHLARLLSNIFANIDRHTPEEAPVRATLRTIGSKINLLIEDGGPGLPTTGYQRDPQSFQRFDKARSREAGGSGLGMSIIFAIVYEHGGEIWLKQSDLGGLAAHITFDKLLL